MSRKPRRYFTDDFKQQIVDLYKAGRKRSELIKEYDLTPSTFDKWVKQARTTGSFKTVDNLTDEQRELKALRKRTKELEMQHWKILMKLSYRISKVTLIYQSPPQRKFSKLDVFGQW